MTLQCLYQFSKMYFYFPLLFDKELSMDALC